MAALTILDCAKIAQRGRPWSFRLEFTGTTPQGNPSDKFWYATGRGLNEAIEIGWGSLGAKPQTTLIDWPTLRDKVLDKRLNGYDYVDAPYQRMSAESLAILGVTKGGTPSVPVAPAVVVQPPQPPQAPIILQQVPASLLALGTPWSLIRKLKLLRNGILTIGYAALDAAGKEVLRITVDDGPDFASKHDLDIEF